MKTRRVINIVTSDCQPDKEIEYNQWLDKIHIPMLLKFDGMLGMTRYKLLGGGQPEYMNIYEFDSLASLEAYQNSVELAAAREEMNQRWKGKGFDIKWRAQYELLKTWKK